MISSVKSKPVYVYSSVIPLVVIATILIVGSAVAVKNKPAQEDNSQVLGKAALLAESGSEDSKVVSQEDGEDSDRDSGSKNSGSSSTGLTVKFQESLEVEDLEEEIELEEDESLETEEIEDSELEIKTKDGKTTVKVKTATTNFQLESHDGELKVEMEDASGTQTELDAATLEKINKFLLDIGVTLGTTSAGFIVKNGKVEVETKFPLSVNLATNVLTVNTPAGSREVTVLPEQAMANLLRNNIINRLTTTGTESAALELTTFGPNNELAFKLEGTRDKKLLGLFPVSVKKKLVVSAKTGETLQISKSQLDQLLDILSF